MKTIIEFLNDTEFKVVTMRGEEFVGHLTVRPAKTDEEKNIYKQFSPDFFDLIVVDECHRGSAKEDSNWRKILEYFSCATQIGMTATPKESEKVSNIDYFGEPVYTYSLKQGIEDGFLAPFKVINIKTNIGEGWRPFKGQLDKNGMEIEDRIYTNSDFDYNIILEAITIRTMIIRMELSLRIELMRLQVRLQSF